MWGGQLISLIGSGLTRFALGVWVFQRTGSVTQFALISMFASLPGLLALPFAGALVDRWDRRRVMLVTDSISALATVGLAFLLWRGSLGIWSIYLFAAIGSILAMFQWPAYVAATTLLVPKNQLGRAAGMMEFGRAAANMAAPAMAGLLVLTLGLGGVLWVDVSTFLIAAATLFLVRVPRPPVSAESRESAGSLVAEARFGWVFIRRRPGLLGLLLYFTILNWVLAIALVLVTPMVLAFASEAVLGTVLAITNGGLVVGSALMTASGGPTRRIHGIFAGGVLFGLALAVAGLAPSAPLLGGALFVMMLGFPFINACSQTIWQSKVPADIQGRVFAVRRMIAQSTAPLGYLVAGPLADRVFEPLMAEGGALAPVLGPWLGTGPGRGIGLLFLCLAVIPILGTVVLYARPRVWRVEDELPDAIPDPAEPKAD